MVDLESSYTYGVLKRAIAENRSGGKIGLSDLAAGVGMSAPIFSDYFQMGRRFAQNYQQYLTSNIPKSY